MRNSVNIYILGIVLVILRRSMAYIGLAIFDSNFTILLFGLIFCVYFNSKYEQDQLGNYKYFVLLLLIGVVLRRRNSPMDILNDIVMFSPVLTFLLLPRNQVCTVLDSVKTIFVWIIGASLVLYFMDMLSFHLPSLGMVHYNQYDMYNYYFLYIFSLNYENRYCGICIEPGYYSLLLVSLLLVYQFNFRLKGTWIIFVALICTFSLGGYLLCLIGFVIQQLIIRGGVIKALKALSLVVVTISLIVYVALNYNQGDNALTEEILMRLVFDEDTGIVGNNRENLLAESVIDSFFYSNAVWFGVGQDVFLKAINIPGYDACTWRQFVVQYGAIYTVILFLISIWFLKKTNMKVVLPFFVVYWADFFQHGDLFMGSFFLLILFMMCNASDEEILVDNNSAEAQTVLS